MRNPMETDGGLTPVVGNAGGASAVRNEFDVELCPSQIVLSCIRAIKEMIAFMQSVIEV